MDDELGVAVEFEDEDSEEEGDRDEVRMNVHTSSFQPTEHL